MKQSLALGTQGNGNDKVSNILGERRYASERRRRVEVVPCPTQHGGGG